MQEYYEQLHTHTFDNIDEINQFFKKHKLSQLTQYWTANWNSPVTTKEIEFTILKLTVL